MKSAEKVVKSTVKESMVVNTIPLKFSKRKEGRAEKKDDGSERRRLTLKERQEKVYPFPYSDIADMLEQLLEKQLIQLSECKRPKQARKVDNLNYCKYHWVISHPVEKRFVLKELILRLAREKKIELDLEECFKFYQDGVKKVEAYSNPFSKTESHFADAKFYLKNENSPEVVPIEIPLGEASTSTTKSMILMDEKTSNPPILPYVPLSRRKKGESPFVKSPKGLKVGDIEVLKESLTTPLTKITKQEVKIDLMEASLP
ncbi:ty3-gypsy retrotransposon protein [Cucumis melo var. makuwa]|uniref:Ty3-gypsy retrotransposon protein n=1 Tax=Cucumis melo var. makuwa TaxID=1194695 RepID=A0A5A7UY84_CUCMM|nr:ty3-gypsy retrotransposon protein [Cucumis melo var. makuwa]TYK07231.1 ty3-gypsy retrotransposon protein [Cucumis melo var. makuwa]